MGRFAKSSTVQVIDGLYIKPSSNSPYWQSYCYIDGKMHRKSTKCKDLEKAKNVALEQYYDFKRNVADGIEPGKVSFEKLTAVYLNSIRHEGKFENHRDAIKRHFTPYFGDVKDITTITTAKMMDYVHHRRGKNEEAPQPQTINRENTVLRQMFAHAVKQAWIKKAPDIERQSERHSLRRRRHFTLEEYRLLHKTARRRIKAAVGNPLRTYTRWQRELLYDYVMFLANSGIRVDESKTVIWRNVDLENGQITLEHAGKVRSSRRIILRKTGVDALRRIKSRREKWLDEHDIVAPISPNEKICSLPDGTYVENFKKGFAALLVDCGFVYADKNDRHTLTSLRHTYATLALTRNWGKRVSMRALAMQMGTSEPMIQRHYGHDQITDYAEELRGD